MESFNVTDTTEQMKSVKGLKMARKKKMKRVIENVNTPLEKFN